MCDSNPWAFPERLQPKPHEVAFDLQSALDAVVMLRADIPEDAFTASILGTERSGNGVVIGPDGLVLTIGYLITEARSVWLTTNDGITVAGYPLAFDFATGFGLVAPLGHLPAPALPRGSSAGLSVDEEVIVIGHGGREHALNAEINDKREFAGYWEYLLDEAIFTVPAHPEWGGAALVSREGTLVGIGSLLVQEAVGDSTMQGNMFVPVDLLEPILDDMLRHGEALRPARPWLGMYVTDDDGRCVVAGLASRAPAESAGVRKGDVVLEVAGSRVSGLADLFRKVWQLGPAGTAIPLTVGRQGGRVRLTLRSGDRNDYLRKPVMH
jgi:S1-C subfamily serine protease